MAAKNDHDEETMDKTSVFDSETLKVRLAKAGNTPPSIVLLVGPRDLVGRQWLLKEDNVILGRSPSSQVYVDDSSISRSHAKLQIFGSEVSIIDLESTNRTAINGRLITPLVPRKLKGNDQIKVGNVIFKFLEQGSLESVSQEEAYRRTQIDPLTGIYNKGALTNKGNELFRKSEKTHHDFGIVVFDLDHFKNINDTHGHQAGDYILKELTSIIQSKVIRLDDFFARFGGEEFVLLLYGSNLKQSTEIAERTRLTVDQHKFEFDGKTLKVTVSCGVACKRPDDKTWEALFERADKSLYVSKGAGRNRVTADQT
jgi:diguanylate cyclase (GGDEF)-like protein